MRVEAPRETVWRVVTEPGYVRQWQYGSTLDTDWSVGTPIRFSSEWQGEHFEQWGTVLSFERPARLSYTLFAPRPGLEDRPENYFTMTYELTDEGGATTLTFVHEDPRPTTGEVEEETSGEENPVLLAVQALAESLVRAKD